MNRIPIARLLDLSLLLGEAAWIATAIAAFIGWGGGDPIRVFPVVLGLLIGGYVVAALAERTQSVFADRWLVAGVAVFGALLAPLVLETTNTVFSPLGFTLWLLGMIAWGRGVTVSNDRQTFSSAGVSFAIGFFVLAVSLIIQPEGPIGIVLPVLFALSYLAAFALANLTRANEMAGGRIGSEWLGTTIASLAVIAGITGLFFTTLGPFLREPAVQLVTLALRLVVGAVIAVVGVLFLILSTILSGLQLPPPPEFASADQEAGDPNEMNFDQIVSLLPDWFVIVGQVIAVLIVVSLVVGVLWVIYRRRRTERYMADAGERSSVFRGDDLRDDLLGLFRRPRKSLPTLQSDPLNQFGADGRWLRSRFSTLATRVDPAAVMTTGAVHRETERDPQISQLAPTIPTFERARYGLQAPAADDIGELRRRWDAHEAGTQ